jgi:sialic acid synthase SpsE
MNDRVSFAIEQRLISDESQTYFIADIAANHDGDLSRAKDLIWLAAEAGADAAKFQHFQAPSIVSDVGFKSLGDQQSHQSTWKKSVYEVYESASVDLSWTADLKTTCQAAGIHFFTTPYALDIVEQIDEHVPAYKIGSGDITWTAMIEKVASKQKPYIIASGASSMDDVNRAVSAGLSINPQLCLMQCNTNYTGDTSNFRHVHLNVLRTFREMYPRLLLGLSDHTPGHTAVLGAVALGARMIEKHFTDDRDRTGPDHAFSMDPLSWREMVDHTRELEAVLGGGVKRVEQNEQETVVLQRRAIRLRHTVSANQRLTAEDIIMLRPCPKDGLPPYMLEEILGRTLRRDMSEGDYIRWTDLD